MNSNFPYYRGASARIERGWLKGGFRDDRGRVCLVRGVLDEAGIQQDTLPDDMAKELDIHLRQYRGYRAIRRATLTKGGTLQDAIMMWNDLPWRRKQAVVHTLVALADSLELDYLRTRVHSLTAEVNTLRERVRRLEAENRGLRRLTRAAALRDDRRTLANLEAELAPLAKRLEAEFADRVVGQED